MRSAHVLSALLLVGASAACTDEVSITSGVCGNYVHDPGEDCDRPGGACTSACRIACDPTARATACASSDAIDGTCCPTGMTCGVDDVCHAATGTVASTVLEQPYDDLGYTVADVNGDLVADLLGVATNTTEIRYGDPTTPFATVVSSRSPTVAPGAQLGFGDIDGDKRLDVVYPTTTGLFAFTTGSGGLDAVEFPATVTPGVVHQRVAFVGSLFNTVPGFVQLDYVPNHLANESPYQLVVSTAPVFGDQTFTVKDQSKSMCGLTSINADAVLRGRAIHPFLDGLALRVPFAIGGTTAGICVMTADPTLFGMVPAYYAVPKLLWESLHPTYKPSGGDGETFFANLVSASGCPDLVVSMTDSMTATDYTMILKGVTGTSGCSVDMLNTDALYLLGKPFAAITLSPVLATSQPGLITSVGVYYNFATTPTIATQPTRAWRYAVVGDLDGDGRQDFATVGVANDVEVFRQLAWSSAQPVQWNDYIIPTTDPVALIALGNFDGDKAGDVAVATVDTTASTAVEDLAVAWGSVDGTFDLEDVGTFGDAHSMVALDLVDTSLPAGIDHNDDLLIARGGTTLTAADPALMIAEYGATTRVMTAPYVFTAQFGSSSPTRATGVAAMVGAFGDNHAPGVAAIFAEPSNGPVTSMNNTALVDLTEQSYGGFTTSPTSLSSSCANSSSPDKPFCVSTAKYATMHRSDGDLFLGLRGDTDGGALSQCAIYFVANGTAPQLSTLSCASLAPAASVATDQDTQAAYAALTGVAIPRNLDNDGTTAHLALITQAVHAQQAFLWELTVDGGVPQLANPIALNSELQNSGALPAGALAHCMNVLEAELGTRVVSGTTYGTGKELVVACSVQVGTSYDTQLWTRYAGPPGTPPYYTLLYDLERDVTVGVYRTGDINGDGLEDLVWVDGTAGRVKLHALLQCDAHRTDCRGGL